MPRQTIPLPASQVQSLMLTLPAAEVEPSGHATHTSESTDAKKLAAHCWHDVAASSATDPASHEEQLAVPEASL
eukprot:3478938-Rhodomonas_salina.3